MSKLPEYNKNGGETMGNAQINGHGSIFEPSSQNEQVRKELNSIVLSKLKSFDKYPFKMYNEEKLKALQEA